MQSRKRPAHFPALSKDNRSRLILVTVCTANRKPLLHRDEVHEIIVDAWNACPEWLVGRYVILPDHVHLFCVPNADLAGALRAWVRKWKAAVSRIWPWPEEQPIWQRNFWDRQIRSGENFSVKWEYVRSNPVRHGLVREAKDWPYQGEMNEFDWHD